MSMSKSMWGIVANVIVYIIKLVCSNYGISVVAEKLNEKVAKDGN